jgi:hypothetical protein
MTFDTFIDMAWTDHGDSPQEVADRLAAALDIVDTPEHIRPFAHLVTHVYGEHLGQWDRGIALLDALRTLPAFTADATIAGSLARNIATLRYAGGDDAVLATLTSDDHIAVLAAAASAFAGRLDFKRAIATYEQALALAAPGLARDSPANRALAAGGNNLAAALEQQDGRDALETEGMIVAANGGLKYWKIAGTWLEEERAEYRLTRSLLKAGRPAAAIQSAARCIDVCARNDAPAIERFYGYVVLALAQRAAGDAASSAASRQAALALHAQVPDEEKQWCASDLAELGP